MSFTRPPMNCQLIQSRWTSFHLLPINLHRNLFVMTQSIRAIYPMFIVCNWWKIVSMHLIPLFLHVWSIASVRVQLSNEIKLDRWVELFLFFCCFNDDWEEIAQLQRTRMREEKEEIAWEKTRETSLSFTTGCHRTRSDLSAESTMTTKENAFSYSIRRMFVVWTYWWISQDPWMCIWNGRWWRESMGVWMILQRGRWRTNQCTLARHLSQRFTEHGKIRTIIG